MRVAREGKGQAMSEYFMITVNSDGEVRVYNDSRPEAIIRHLDKDEDTGELTSEPFGPYDGFDIDPQEWDDGRVLIIKGEVVVPKPVSIDYELE